MRRVVSNLTNQEKCSWFVSAPAGKAPYFYIETSPYDLINSSYDLHYIEHDPADWANENTNELRLTTEVRNRSVFYNKSQFDG